MTYHWTYQTYQTCQIVGAMTTMVVERVSCLLHCVKKHPGSVGVTMVDAVIFCHPEGYRQWHSK
jgi:hypothetical protein